jgi:hypothetical protein
MQQSPSIPESIAETQVGSKGKGLVGSRLAAQADAKKPRGSDPNWSSDRSSQGMVQPNFLSLNRLKSTWFSVLLSNPLTKDDFPIHLDRALVFMLSFLFATGM